MVQDVLTLEQGFVDLALAPGRQGDARPSYIGDAVRAGRGQGLAVAADPERLPRLARRRLVRPGPGRRTIPREVKLAFYLTDVRSGAFQYIKGTHGRQAPRPVRADEVERRRRRRRSSRPTGRPGPRSSSTPRASTARACRSSNARHAVFYNYHDPSVPLQKEDVDYYRYHPLLLNAAFLGRALRRGPPRPRVRQQDELPPRLRAPAAAHRVPGPDAAGLRREAPRRAGLQERVAGKLSRAAPAGPGRAGRPDGQGLVTRRGGGRTTAGGDGEHSRGSRGRRSPLAVGRSGRQRGAAERRDDAVERRIEAIKSPASQRRWEQIPWSPTSPRAAGSPGERSGRSSSGSRATTRSSGAEVRGRAPCGPPVRRRGDPARLHLVRPGGRQPVQGPDGQGRRRRACSARPRSRRTSTRASGSSHPTAGPRRPSRGRGPRGLDPGGRWPPSTRAQGVRPRDTAGGRARGPAALSRPRRPARRRASRWRSSVREIIRAAPRATP